MKKIKSTKPKENIQIQENTKSNDEKNAQTLAMKKQLSFEISKEYSNL